MTKSGYLTKPFISAAFLISMLIPAAGSYSQMVFGVDVSDPGNTKGYNFNNANDAADSEYYLKNDPGIFDRIVLTRGKGYTFTIDHPSANRFLEVYDSLRTAFGYENEVMDSIPSGINDDDYVTITLLILDGKARILRYWYEEKFNVKLEFTGEYFKVLLAYN